jgi:hypothetical protein
MNSSADFTGSEGFTDIMLGDTATSATAVKSFAGSYESLLYSAALIACDPTLAMISV